MFVGAVVYEPGLDLVASLVEVAIVKLDALKSYMTGNALSTSYRVFNFMASWLELYW